MFCSEETMKGVPVHDRPSPLHSLKFDYFTYNGEYYDLVKGTPKRIHYNIGLTVIFKILFFK